jgi:hypothetical protein
MNKVYTGMLAPEMIGVSGSKWLVIDGDTITITNIRNYPILIEELKAKGHEIVLMDIDQARHFVERLI